MKRKPIPKVVRLIVALVFSAGILYFFVGGFLLMQGIRHAAPYSTIMAMWQDLEMFGLGAIVGWGLMWHSVTKER